LEKTEGDIKELSESAVNLKSNYLELTELKHVLEKTQAFFNEQDEANGLDSAHKALITEDTHNVSIRGRLGFVAGVINRERVPGFERMLWRISRGNVFLRQVEIDKPLEDPATVRKKYSQGLRTANNISTRAMRFTKLCLSPSSKENS
jgi:V-type H+-transporting ATPase subunit a